MSQIRLAVLALFTLTLALAGCDQPDSRVASNQTALNEQAQTEKNQETLFRNQPPPRLTWSMERDNLIKRDRLQNDRGIYFFMYVFIEGVGEPLGYYQVNKVSSVDSQLTNTMQIVPAKSGDSHWVYNVLPSPSEDGSYGTNGAGVFGFTPEDIYIETNMKFIVSTVPLQFAHPVQRLAIVSSEEARTMLEKSKEVMRREPPKPADK